MSEQPSDSTGFSSDAYWLEDVPKARSDTLPIEVDVLVVGAGYTGVNAALEVAKGGASVVVVDALVPGGGCSTRNGGQVSPDIEHEPGTLAKRFGAETAEAIKAEAVASVDWLERFVASHGIDCDFRRSGLFYAAHTPKAFEWMQHHAGEVDARVVPKSEQRQELGTDAHFGGLVLPKHGGLHPAKYFHGLLGAARAAGARVIGQCPVLEIVKDSKGFKVLTAKGMVRAQNVAIATNGYTTRLQPWIARRVVPIGSYMIATEQLNPSLIKQLFPTDRMVIDSRSVIYYYRASPDGTRVIFGGRVSAGETDTKLSAPRLKAEMVRLFPELSKASITHSWMGKVAFTFDEMPRTGCQNGIYHALGYCGSGVAMSGYLGMRMGQRILGLSTGATVFDDLSAPTMPFYRGKPWFLPAAVAIARMKDSFEIWRAKG